MKKTDTNAHTGRKIMLSVCICVCVVSIIAAAFAGIVYRSGYTDAEVQSESTGSSRMKNAKNRIPASTLKKIKAEVECEISTLIGARYEYIYDAEELTAGLSKEEAYDAIFADAMKRDISSACRVSIEDRIITYAPDEESVVRALDDILVRKNEMYSPHGAKVVLSSDVHCESVYCLSGWVKRDSELSEALLVGDPFLSCEEDDRDRNDPDNKDDEDDKDDDGNNEKDDTYYSKYALIADVFSDPDTSDGTFLKFRTIVVESENITLAYAVTYEYSFDYPAGTEFVRTKGADGLGVIYWEVSYENGEEVGRSECDFCTEIEPTDEVVIVGTHPTETTGTFFWPCNSVTITSQYQATRTIFGESDVHGGLDIGARSGSPVWASDGGEVIFAGNRGTYGNLVIIDHGNKYTTYYAHLSVIQVKKGDRVFQGQQIGLVGQTGRATGPHLHFEVRYNGNRRNPLRYIGTKTCRLGEGAKELY